MNFFYVFAGNMQNSLVGVMNKIQSQKKSFEACGWNVTLINIFKERCFWFRCLSYLNLFADHHSVKGLLNNDEHNSIFYFRFMLFDFYILKVFRHLKRNGNIVVVEIPTYPFIKELNYISGKILYCIHCIYMPLVKKYIDFFVTYSKHSKIYGVESIPISNGIDINKFPVKNKVKLEENMPINLLMVARFSLWHGVDRLINGLEIYCNKKNRQKVILHLVGDGDALESLKIQVTDKGLEESVVFHGTFVGEKLDSIYDSVHVGIGSLGCHRIGIYSASVLKSREYCVRGLPFICSVDTPDIPGEFPYIKYFPANESPIDIQDVIDFAERVYLDERIRENMRAWAVNNLSWEKKMIPVVRKLQNMMSE